MCSVCLKNCISILFLIHEQGVHEAPGLNVIETYPEDIHFLGN